MSELSDKLYGLIYHTAEVAELSAVGRSDAEANPVRRQVVVIRRLFMNTVTFHRLSHELGGPYMPVTGRVNPSVLGIPVTFVHDMPSWAISGASFIYGDPL